MVKKSVFVTVLLIMFFWVTPVFAGGGRYRLESYSSPGYTGTNGVYIQAWITNQNQSALSVGEKAEFRIQNARAGDRCETTTAITTDNGQIFGVCFASQAGQILVYVHSFDNNEDSSPYVLYFYDKPTSPPTMAVIATITPAKKMLPTKLPSLTSVENKASSVMNNEITITPILKPTNTAITPTPQLANPQKRNVGQLFFNFFVEILSKLFGK